MNLHFLSVYRISMYIMLFLSTLILNIDAGDYNQFAWVYPVLVAGAGIVAFCTVDRNPRLGLPRELANVLALGSFVLAMMEYWSNPEALILAMGHWMVYLQFVKMFLPKTSEDDWFLFLLALAQVLVGAFLSRGDWMGWILFAYSAVCLWNLSLFHLKRELDVNQAASGVRIEPSPDRERPYSGLFSRVFFVSTATIGLSTLALGSLIFLLLPRWSESSTGRNQPGLNRQITGFSEQVRLGQMGEILENDSLVMTVEVLDGEKQNVGAGEELLFRGVTLADYENGQWSKGPVLASELLGSEILEKLPATPVLRQKIRLEPNNSNVLFSQRPVIAAFSARNDEIQINQWDGTLIKQKTRTSTGDDPARTERRTPYSYEVISSRVKDAQNLSVEFPPAPELLKRLTRVPPSLTEKLQSISKRLLKDKVPANPELRAKLTEEALRDSNEYSYSLTMIRTDPGDDPVLDFLENHKRGHCEYFASSLALLLRVQGIPTRVVNGFKGGEWNGLVGAYTFRDKHAHSWVEALITDANGRNLRWVTLDPTPGLERDAGIAQVGRGPRQFRTLSDAVRYIWTFYVAGFDSDRQNRVIYQPLRTVALEIWRVFKAAALKLTALAYGLFHYQSFGELVSIRGFFASVSLMLIAVGLFQGVRKLARSMIRGKKKHTDRDEEIPELALFNRLLAIMAGTGLQRKSTETPKEYASRAGDWLGTHFPSTENLASIPAEIVHAVYRVRFGKYPLAAHTADSLSAQLDLLQTRLAEPSSPEHLNRTST